LVDQPRPLQAKLQLDQRLALVQHTMLCKEVGLRAEYELYNNLDSGTGESNVHFLSAGVIYRF
jgi:hypothetical protein